VDARITFTVYYVVQCRYPDSDPDQWSDLSRKDTPGEAFARLDFFRGRWDRLRGTRGVPEDSRVVHRHIADTVLTDPRELAAELRGEKIPP
jgi:hypothetical protein